MKPLKKKGFTIVELVIVIAVIAVLAAVLIPTFSSIVDKANESAYLQEKTNQQIMDAVERLENKEYFGWDEFEAMFAGLSADSSIDEIRAAVEAAIREYNAKLQSGDTGLTEEQIQKILKHILKDLGLTKEQIQDILDDLLGQIGAINVTGITLDKTQIEWQCDTTLKETLTATISPGDASNQWISWTSSNPNVATFDGWDWAFGEKTVTVACIGPGTTTITATTSDGGYTATCTITVALSPADQLDADLESGKDVTMTENLTVNRIGIPAGANTTLDLGDKELAFTGITINGNSTLTIKNGKLSGAEPIVVFEGGTLIVDNVDVTAAGTGDGPCIRNLGTATIKNNSRFTTTRATGALLLYNAGTMTVTDCSFTSAPTGTISAISNNRAIQNGGTLTLTNVTVTAEGFCVLNADEKADDGFTATVTIDRGTYKSTEAEGGSFGAYAINAGNNGKVVLQNGVKIYAPTAKAALKTSGGITYVGTEGTDYTISTIS